MKTNTIAPVLAALAAGALAIGACSSNDISGGFPNYGDDASSSGSSSGGRSGSTSGSSSGSGSTSGSSSSGSGSTSGSSSGSSSGDDGSAGADGTMGDSGSSGAEGSTGNDATTGSDATVGDAAGDVVGALDSAPAADTGMGGDAAACVQTDPTHWIYMCDPHQCDNRPGIPCGYTMTNGGQGYTCGCEFPGDLDPWGCQPPDAGVGMACPSGDAGTTDSASSDATSDAATDGASHEDGSSSTDGAVRDAEGADAGWVDMLGPDGGDNAHACDEKPGAPCGWSPVNNGLGFTCGCRHPEWMDPWTCEGPDAGIGMACAADAATE